MIPSYYALHIKRYILRIVLHVIDVIRDVTMTLHGTKYISVVLDDYVAHASVYTKNITWEK